MLLKYLKSFGIFQDDKSSSNICCKKFNIKEFFISWEMFDWLRKAETIKKINVVSLYVQRDSEKISLKYLFCK